MAGERRRLHGEALGGPAAALHLGMDEVLAGVLAAAGRGEADEIRREIYLAIEAGVDGGDDLCGESGIEWHGGIRAGTREPSGAGPSINRRGRSRDARRAVYRGAGCAQADATDAVTLLLGPASAVSVAHRSDPPSLMP